MPFLFDEKYFYFDYVSQTYCGVGTSARPQSISFLKILFLKLQNPFPRSMMLKTQFKTIPDSLCVPFVSVNFPGWIAWRNTYLFIPEKFNTNVTCVATFSAKRSTFWTICVNTRAKSRQSVKFVGKLSTKVWNSKNISNYIAMWAPRPPCPPTNATSAKMSLPGPIAWETIWRWPMRKRCTSATFAKQRLATSEAKIITCTMNTSWTLFIKNVSGVLCVIKDLRGITTWRYFLKK